MDGLSTIFESIRADHPEFSGNALVAQARVLNASQSSSRMMIPKKMSFRNRLLSLPLRVCFSVSSPASAAAWTQPESLYRYFVWGAQFAFSSRADDYRRYGHHTIDPAPTAFHFKPGKRDLVPETVEYDDGQGVKRVALSELLQTTGTHAFIVIRDDQVLYENYFNGFAR